MSSLPLALVAVPQDCVADSARCPAALTDLNALPSAAEGLWASPLATVEPDADWERMWRVRLPDGSLTDLVNLTRAKDALKLLNQRGPQ